MDRSNVRVIPVGAGASDSTTGYVVPNGTLFVVKKIGGAVPAKNDGYSANVVLRWGTEIIRPLVLYGASEEVQLNKEFVGDGTTEINILVQNESTVPKNIAVWYDAYEREE